MLKFAKLYMFTSFHEVRHSKHLLFVNVNVQYRLTCYVLVKLYFASCEIDIIFSDLLALKLVREF
jgi:hypothetical protein